MKLLKATSLAFSLFLCGCSDWTDPAKICKESFSRERARAIENCQKSANGGNSESQFLLGELLRTYGDAATSESKRLEEAVSWFKRAAEQGHSKAQLRLAQSYYLGKGIPKDVPEAIRWLMRSANQDEVHAMYLLGWFHYKKIIYSSGYEKAEEWLQRAANKGHISAQELLLQMFESDQTSTLARSEAVKWYRSSAERGSMHAQWKLGEAYMGNAGSGALQNFVLAHMWLNLSAHQGNSEAAVSRDKVAVKMSADQIEKAQSLAAKCLKSKYKGCENEAKFKLFYD